MSVEIIKLVARVLIATRFILSFFLRMTLWTWTIADFNREAFPKAQAVLLVAQAWQLGAGLLLLFGLKTRIACAMLVVFVTASSFTFHQFWQPGQATPNLFIDFIKDMAIIGGLLMVAACGPGRFSLDTLLSTKPPDSK